MTKYITRRLINSIIVLLLVSLMVFSAVYYLADDVYWGPQLSEKGLERLGLILGADDRSFPEAYAKWTGLMITGDWGETCIQYFPDDN